MKLNTRYIILSIVAALAVAALGGCQREELNDSVCDGILNFRVGFAGSGEIALSKGATLTSEDGTVSIPLSCTVTDGIGVDLPDAAMASKSASMTKGQQINSETEFLNAELKNFIAQGWNTDKSPFIPSETVNYNDGLWQTTKVYRWANSVTRTFLAYANLPAGATVSNSIDPVKQTFSYTVPTDARQQNDIMLGWYEGNGGGTATAAITMVHPLTAVVFKKGEIDASVSAIKSISISGVYESGAADVTYALSGSDVVPGYSWTSCTGSQTVTLSPVDGATELEVGADNVIGEPFIILPQNVTAGTLKLKITIVKDGADGILTASVPAGTWEEGKTNTFTIGYIGQYVDLGLSVKWGNFNLGASKREEYGEYYSWAGLENVASTSINLDFSHCPYHTGSDQDTGWTKYNSLSGRGTVDNKTILDLDDDVAHVKKQGPWHMPTEAQWQELIDNCTWEWVDDFNGTGVAGMKVTSRIAGYTDRYIFLPAAGYRTGNALNNVGTICDYWYPQMKADNTYGAYYIYISEAKPHTKYDNNRYTGRPGRPVYDDIPKTITAKPASGCEAMGTVTGSGSYLFGETATLSATPADGYVFSKWNDGVTTATRTITVTAASTYEATFETSPVLPGEFSVSATKKVHFAKGNLFCKRTGSAGSYTYEFAMESHQYDYRTRPLSLVSSLIAGPCVIDGVMGETPDNMSGFFLWDIYDKAGYGAFETSLTSGTTAGSDVLDYGQVFGSDSEWTTLTKSEFEYLTNGGLFSSARPNAVNLIKKAIIHLSGTVDILGYVIAPDDFTGTLAEEYTLSEWETAEESSSLVFLPWIGSVSGHSISSSGIFYWSQSASETNDYYAYCLKQNSDVPAISGTSRGFGFPVRLVQEVNQPEIEPTFIDLDLPSGTLWADVNVGATSKTGVGSYGNFYAWGETETKATFTIDNYEFTSSFNKYNGTDCLTRLQSNDDVAASKVSGSHIPTRLQFEELLNSEYTTYSWKDDYNGVPGLLIASKSNGNSVFLPAAGLQNEDGPALIGNNGCYWSSTLNPTPDPGTGTAFPACAIDLDFVRDNTTPPFLYQENDNSRRLSGQSVRAVKEKPKTIETE